MKVLPFKIPKPKQEALVYQEDFGDILYNQLHQHEEIQISYVVKGAGTLVVGDTINDYKEDDILIIGENIPHVFRSDRAASDHVIMYTLFFTKTSFGKDFFLISDLNEVEDFFSRSTYGMKMNKNENSHEIIKIFNELKHQNKINQIASLLTIIDLVTNSETTPLSSFVYRKRYTDDEGKRMSAVIEHAMKFYYKTITLEEVAEIANMSKNAFCRYFKKRTNKTFFQFLIEVRIENACKLLLNKNNEHTISTISELCGFQDIANFNRKFKQLKGVSPSVFRAQY